MDNADVYWEGEEEHIDASFAEFYRACSLDANTLCYEIQNAQIDWLNQFAEETCPIHNILLRPFLEEICAVDEPQVSTFSVPDEVVPLPLYHIFSMPYTPFAANYIQRVINNALSTMEDVHFHHDICCARWRCIYGTIPLDITLSPKQKIEYNKKMNMFRSGFVFSNHLHHRPKQIYFSTVSMTQKLGVPFNFFAKKGITEEMRENLRKEIKLKAQELFPNNDIGFTVPYTIGSYDNDIQSLEEILNRRSWSNSEIMIRNSMGEMRVYYDRLAGDSNSTTFIENTLKTALMAITKTEMLWELRKEYIITMEGTNVHGTKLFANHGTTLRYLGNEMIMREVCTFIE